MPWSSRPATCRLAGSERRAAVASTRLRPGSAASVASPLRTSSMRTPTAPGVRFQSAMISRDGRIGRIHRLDQRKSSGMALVHLERIAGVVAVHREGRHQDRAVDAGSVHLRHHLVARDLRRTCQHAVPRPAGTIALVGMHLGVDGQHVCGSPINGNPHGGPRARRGGAASSSEPLMTCFLAWRAWTASDPIASEGQDLTASWPASKANLPWSAGARGRGRPQAHRSKHALARPGTSDSSSDSMKGRQ